MLFEGHLMKLDELANTILRGMSQIMLQNNALTGLLFLLGILLNSWQMLVAALLGVVSGTAAAVFFRYEKKGIMDGLYGFNGALVGLALVFFFQPSALLAILIIAGAALSSLIMNFMHRKKMSPYTFPFILSAWIMIALAGVSNVVLLQPQSTTAATSLDAISALSMGFGQVMFQANIVTGIIFLAAIFVSSRMGALHAFVGSAIGMLLALALSFPLGLANIGIYGFNGVLCGAAFAGSKKHALAFTATAAALSVFIIHGMMAVGIPALTAPFVFSTWILLAVREKIAA